MKAFTFLLPMMFLLSVEAMAQKSNCDTGFRSTLKCTAVASPSDSPFLKEFVGSVEVCTKGSVDMLLLSDATGNFIGGSRATKTVRAGATTYRISVDGMNFSLSKMVVSPTAATNGRITLVTAGLESSRLLRCR